ncbi:Riean_0653 family protein [Spirosoma jeollabukense]
MKPIHVFTLLWLVFSLGRCSCNPEPAPSDQLPAETQEGKNTFGCRVNGDVWLPRASVGLAIPSGVDLSYDPGFDGGTMSLKATRWYRDAKDQLISTRDYIDVAIGQLVKPGQYSLNTVDKAGVGDYSTGTQDERDKTKQTTCIYNETGDTRVGSLTITKLDMAKRIMAGRFEFTITKKDSMPSCPKIIRITDGRFDMTF